MIHEKFHISLENQFTDFYKTCRLFIFYSEDVFPENYIFMSENLNSDFLL